MTSDDSATIQYGGRKLLQSISSFILNLCSSAKSYHSVRKVWSFHKCLLSYVRNVWRFCRAYRSNKDLLPSLIGVPMSHPLVLLKHPGIEYGLISGEVFIYHILSFCDKSPFEIKLFPSYFSYSKLHIFWRGHTHTEL